MISFNQTTFFWILVILLLCFLGIKKVFYFLVFSSVLALSAVFYIGEDNVLVYHIVFLILFLKFLVLFSKMKRPVRFQKGLLFFVLWCFITLPFSLLHRNTVVMNVNSKMMPVSFSYHQITQFVFLLIGFLTFVICSNLLSAGIVQVEGIEKYLRWAYVFTLVLALSQHYVPAETISAYFRNATYTGYAAFGSRISGTFGEPSHLSLFCTPICASYIYLFFSHYKFRHLILALLFGIVTFDNFSSSGILGIAFSLVLIFIIRLVGYHKVSKRRILALFGFFAFIVLIVALNWDIVSYGYDAMVKKLNGEGVSGEGRTFLLLYHLKEGFKHIIPTGYGTVRSSDLLSTWICSIGLLGVLLYVIPVALICIKLFRINTERSITLFLCIMVHNFIMFVSVAEVYFLSIWFYYGMAIFVIKEHDGVIPQSEYMGEQLSPVPDRL